MQPDDGDTGTPAVWLLEAGVAGVGLTQTFALSRAVVRDAALRWRYWWDAELFGPPHRETDLAPLHALHDGLKRLGLVRRRGRRLLSTPSGRSLVTQPDELVEVLASDLGAGDPFTALIADAVVRTLAGRTDATHDELSVPALRAARHAGWRHRDGASLEQRDVRWALSDVLIRGEAYSLIAFDRRRRLSEPSRLRLTPRGRGVLAPHSSGSTAMGAYVFNAKLENARGVSARLAVRSDQRLTDLHDVIQEAFGWLDDHLYSFWLDGRYWGDQDTEYTSPVTPDEAPRTADDTPLLELDLSVETKIAYVFDFGDEWRVKLTLAAIENSDTDPYPRVISRRGQAPPQYGDPEE